MVVDERDSRIGIPLAAHLPVDKEAYWRWAAIGVIVLGLGLRLFHLGTESLWNDELSSVFFSSHGPLAAIGYSIRDTGPPLYYVLQSLLLLVVPANEITMRLLPAVFGSLSIWLIYLVGLRMYSRPVGVVAAGLFAVSRWGIALGQEARAYSLATLLVLCIAYSLLLLIERPSPIRYIAHGVCIVLAAYSHLFGGIAVAGIVLGVLLRPRIARRLGWEWVATLGVAALFFVPWLFVLGSQAAFVADVSTAGRWALTAPSSISNTMIKGMYTYAPWGNGNELLAVLFLAVATFGAFAMDEMSREVRSGSRGETGFDFESCDRVAILTSWLLMVYAGSLLVSKFLVPIYSTRMVIVAAPALYLLAANGLTRVWRPAAILLLAAGLVMSVKTLHTYYAQPQKEPWRPVTKYLLSVHAERDSIIGSAPWMLKNASEYAKILGRPEGLRGTKISSHVSRPGIDWVLGRVLKGKSSAYLVLGHVPLVRGSNTAVDLGILRQGGWRLVEFRQFGRIKVKHYVRRSQ